MTTMRTTQGPAAAARPEFSIDGLADGSFPEFRVWSLGIEKRFLYVLVSLSIPDKVARGSGRT